MATVAVVFGNWHSKQPVMTGHLQTQALTSSGTSQDFTAAPSNVSCVEVVTSGGDVWISLNGSAASATNGFYLPDGTTRTFDSGPGTVVKVIDA